MNDLTFTDQELIIVKDVKRKNFYQRGVPLTLAGLLTCNVLMKRGILKPSWPFLKYFTWGATGYLASLVSSARELRTRLINEAPDGVVARNIRATENMSPDEKKEYYRNKRQQMSQHSANTDTVNQPSPALQERSSSYPGDRSLYPQPPSPESDNVQGTSEPTQSFSYSKQRMLNNQQFGGEYPPPSATSLDEQKSSMQHSNNRNARRNKYGDDME